MKRLLPVLILVPLAGLAGAQTLSEYLKLRSKLGITKSIGVDSLDKLVGAHVVELKGTVKGTLQVGDTFSLMLEKSDGGMMVVESGKMPSWLEGNEVPARLIVRAERTTEYSEVRARLIGAAPEADIAAVEAKAKPPVKKAPPKKTPTKAAPKGPGLWGPIGKRGSTNAGGGQPKKEWVVPVSEATPHYAAFIKKRNPRLSEGEAWRIAEALIGFSIQAKVDARLVVAMVMIESGFNPNAISRAGAAGLGQLMPGTARGYGVNPHNAVENLYASVKILRGHLRNYKAKTGDDYQSLVLVLAAYNAGAGAVKRHGGVPPYRETQNHIRKVIATYNKLCGY